MLMTPPMTERDNEEDKSPGRGNIIINITDESNKQILIPKYNT